MYYEIQSKLIALNVVSNFKLSVKNNQKRRLMLHPPELRPKISLLLLPEIMILQGPKISLLLLPETMILHHPKIMIFLHTKITNLLHPEIMIKVN
jgi:hypothetical protein